MSSNDRQPRRESRGPDPKASGLNLPKREKEILKFWERNRIFEKTLEKTKRLKPFIFYEGPPTANGSPGIHHFEARAFKDLIPRYKTMRGFYVGRKAGWDTHGLPVEIQVEKELGLKSKKDIEKYGIAKFNAQCRESVWRYKEEWDRFTHRIGFWLDLAHPYVTYENSYIETLWWIIKEIWKKKLLYQDFKVVPWCPRCETGLSTHELGQGYETVMDRSIYVRFRVKAKSKDWQNTSILSWTTTPWTLPGNVALAVNPSEDYVCIPDPDFRGRWVVLGQKRFRDLVEKHYFPPEYRSSLMLDDIDTFKGQGMVGLEYEPLFNVKELASQRSHQVYAADFVTMEEGTGVVHTAVMYGVDDYRLGTKVGLPKFHTVTETGHFIRRLAEGLGGLYVKDPKTEEKIIGSLKRRGLLFKEELYEHDYPFCWRCETPVLYYARNAWWVKVSAKRKELLANNEKINWVPAYLKHGRFGEFLKEARDWAFSRERYWGTPLPVWQCEGGHIHTVGSLEELDDLDQAPTTLVVMRHGEVPHNIKELGNPISAENDRRAVLTAKGKRQALAAAKKLKKERIEVIVSSPSFRTRETAKIVAKKLGISAIHTIPELRDVAIGPFEGKPIAEFKKEFADFSERFWKKPDGTENLREVRARVMKAAAVIRGQYSGKKILVLTHGDPSWILMAALAGMPEDKYAGADYLKPAEFKTIRLHNWPYDPGGEVNLHKPYADEIRLQCRSCGKIMRRVSEVVDTWFDSGAMPFAQAHYPFAWAQHQKSRLRQGFGGQAKIKNQNGGLLYPADYICEGVDQTRGWFYTLLAVSTLLGRGPSYKNVVSLGHVLDKHGQKMSKSKDNIVEPLPMVEKYGADTIRWYFYTINAPGDPKRFDEKDLLLKLRGPISTLWNSFVFFSAYVDKLTPIRYSLSPRHVLDQWVLARLDDLTGEVTGRLDHYDIFGAARRLESFIVDDFSNWYLRRSRRRFQKPESKKEKDEAAATMAHVLLRLVELMAPFTPFLAEIIYQEIKPKPGHKEESVHLRAWPAFAKAAAGKPSAKRLLDGMAEVRRLAALALGERAKAGMKVRQPLTKLKVKSPAFAKASAGRQKLKVRELVEVLRDEVNVKEVVIDPRIKNEVELDMTVTPQLREEGLMRELVRNIQEMRRDAGLKPQHTIRLQVSGDRETEAVIERWRKFIQSEAGVTSLQFGGKREFTVEREVKLDGLKLWIGIRKA